MRRSFQRLTLPAALLLSTGCAGPGANGGIASPDPAATRAARSITASGVGERIAYLASDAMRGRDTPSPELERAAAWIASELESFGLEPAGDEGWMQRYPFPLTGLDVGEARLDIVSGATHTLQYGEEFFAQPGSGLAGAVGVTFVGDDVPAGSLAFRDRAVLVRLSGYAEPARGGTRLDRDARDRAAAQLERAQQAGAAAVVFILEPTITPDQIEGLAATAGAPVRRLGEPQQDRLPAFFITRSAASRIFRDAGLDAAEQLRREVDRPIALPGVTLRLAAPVRVFEAAWPPNVVGILRGSDPALRDSYVVLSAHMDHIGVGRPVDGDSINNGADDNATGTSAIIEIARALVSLPVPPRRSVLVLAVSGEEKGLLGSRWYSDHPTVPIDAIVANLNIDMVGRNAPDSIVVIGQEYSSLGPWVQEVARRSPELGLTVSEDIWPDQRFFFRSDHFNFARKEVPALFFFAGVHEDYHRPGDEMEKIDLDKTARVARLVFLLTHSLAQSERTPEWSAEGLEEVRRLTR